MTQSRPWTTIGSAAVGAWSQLTVAEPFSPIVGTGAGAAADGRVSGRPAGLALDLVDVQHLWNLRHLRAEQLARDDAGALDERAQRDPVSDHRDVRVRGRIRGIDVQRLLERRPRGRVACQASGEDVSR